jgi:hypothetical protein
MKTGKRRPEWFLYPGWIVLSTLGIPLTWFTSLAIISQAERIVGDTIVVAGRTRITEDFLIGYLFFPLLGLLTGFLQYLLLRRYLPRMGWWVAATTLGWPLGIAVLYFGYTIWPVDLSTGSMWGIALVLVSAGTAMGFTQWLILRRRLPHAGWWILASALGWSLVSPITGQVFTTMLQLLTLGVVPAVVTGVALWWLLARLPQHEMATSQ